MYTYRRSSVSAETPETYRRTAYGPHGYGPQEYSYRDTVRVKDNYRDPKLRGLDGVIIGSFYPQFDMYRVRIKGHGDKALGAEYLQLVKRHPRPKLKPNDRVKIDTDGRGDSVDGEIATVEKYLPFGSGGYSLVLDDGRRISLSQDYLEVI